VADGRTDRQTYNGPARQQRPRLRILYTIVSRGKKDLLIIYLRDIITIKPPRSTRSSSLVTLLHPQTQSSLKITNRSFRYAAPHLWNKLPPSFRVLYQSATSECSPPSPGCDSAINRWSACLTGSSILVLKLTFSPDPFPVTFLSL